jgi:acyl-coenzyme A synthetase/AMP-(fatty) acid ligase
MSGQTLIGLLDDFARSAPNRIALIDGLSDEQVSYSDFRDRVAHVACGLLDAELKPGDNMILFMEAGVELAVFMFAAARIGVPCLPLLGPDHKPNVVDRARQLFNPKLFVYGTASVGYSYWKVSGESWRHADEVSTSSRRGLDIAMPKPDDVFYYNMSSGSTADSKIVPATHRQVIINARACAEVHHYRPSDRHLCTFNGHQHDLFTRALVTGATSVLLAGAQDDPERLAAALVSHGVTCLMGAPMTLSAFDVFIGDKLRGSRLRLIECGGGALSEKIKRSLAQKTGAACISVFGATEIGGVAFAPPLDTKGPRHSIGPPLPGYHIRLIKDDGTKANDGEPGQLIIEGFAVAKGYVFEPPSNESTRLKDHVFRTGDLARRHSNGWYEIIGSIANTCKVCGIRVSLERVERAIRDATPIRDVVVVPRRQFPIGNVLVALYVTPETGFRIDYEGIKALLAEPVFELPRAFLPIKAIPTNAAGKVDRAAARLLVNHGGAGHPWRERMRWRVRLLVLRPKVFGLLCQAANSRKHIVWLAIKHPIKALKTLVGTYRALGQP